MNYLRMKGKNISLTSIDYIKNTRDYLLFNSSNKNKTMDELRDDLNNYARDNYFAIVENGSRKLVGLIGFKNLIQSNQRTNIDLILSEELTEEKSLEYGSEALKMISDYSFNALNLHNLLCQDSNLESYDMYVDAGYEYIGSRHAAKLGNDSFKDVHLFQKLPSSNMVNKSVIVPNNIIINKPNNLSINELPEIVNGQEITLIKPDQLDNKTISYVRRRLGKSMNDSYDASAMGEYKMIYNDFRLNNKLSGKGQFDYLILDENGNPIGYVDRLHVDKKNFCTDIEINIFNKSTRNKGYGHKAYELYVNVLRNSGYISIGSVVFDFNKPSLNMHEKLGFNPYAIRNESYFAFGKLNDMHYYEAGLTNDLGYSKSKGSM